MCQFDRHKPCPFHRLYQNYLDYQKDQEFSPKHQILLDYIPNSLFIPDPDINQVEQMEQNKSVEHDRRMY